MSEWTAPGYTQLTVLGEGGFGRVVLARHDATSRVVAIKYLHTVDETSRARFRHEAAILHRVVSPHVARLYQFVETAEGAAIVMEAVPGVPLKEILEQHGTLTPEAALAILKGSLLGLAAAHTAGTVHRDYKPGNVLVQPNNQSKLVDFGIALLAGHSGHSGGTPAYMAPEQWQGGPATPATDVYAATCVFFLCVTGFRPFPDTDTERLRHAHQYVAPPVERVPEPVRALVARGMAKDVATRPGSAAAFVKELEAAAVAGYGKNWESKGWQRLAGYAGTLLAASPMAWLVSSTGVLSGGGSVAAAGGAAGSAVAAKAATGAVAAKVAAAVVGAAVVVGATVIVVNTTGDDPPAAEPFAVSVRTEQASYPVNLDTSTQIVQVSGTPNADAVNAALRAPADAQIREVRDNIEGLRSTLRDAGDERWDAQVDVDVEATVLMQGTDYVSVRYANLPDTGLMTTSSATWQDYDTVTVDVRTGKAVTTDEIFRPDAAGHLADLLLAQESLPQCPDIATGDARIDLTEENLGREVQVAFTRDHASFTVFLPRLGRANACGVPTVDMPYDELTEVLDPAFVDKLTAG
ncbi:serine/threonine-protein kinase [Actinophytocola sp. NPDC049390]|uniref:serine/threonine-protein kinase n=1 Tax=Actinophytocola sp. NPDC049390 TaxID=3363894 RepID=UPI00379078D9